MKAKIWGWTIFALVGIGAILFAVAFATGFQQVTGFLWSLPAVAMDVAVCAAAGLALGMQRSNRPRLKVVASASAMALWILFILSLFNIPSASLDHWYGHLWDAVVALIMIFGAWTTAGVPLLAMDPTTRLLRILRRVTWILCIASAAVWIIYYFEDQYLKFDDTPVRAALVFTSAAALASVLCLLGGLYLAPSQSVRAQPIEIAIVLCPRCGTACDANDLDHCTCAHCQLPIELDRGEPRCACGYLLVNLNGTTCPECGKSFKARIRYELTSV